jgi:membrane-bound lytic murein transglycosylase D
MSLTRSQQPGTSLAIALALILAGCSARPTTQSPSAEKPIPVAQTTATTTSASPIADDTSADPEDAIEQTGDAPVDRSDPQNPVADAIATLDLQHSGERPLVSEHGGAESPAVAHVDLLARMRNGFTIDDVDHPAVDRELRWFVNHPAYLDRTFSRGERYLYHIVGELERRKMPLELALLPVVESAFNPMAYSRARASGLWQFIPGTGKRYGLKQNWYYDGRRDVVAATDAALDYLQALADEFDGDWLLAIAAYNSGEMNVERALAKNRKAGKPTDFFSLPLPRETRAYVPKLLAMRRIVDAPESHGLDFATIPNQPYFTKVNVGGQIDLHVAAELADMSKEELLALNPCFNHWVTDPEGPFELLVPLDREERLIAGLADLPPEKRVRIVYHRVARGESLGKIAGQYGVSVAALREANGLKSNSVRPGQDLLITAAPRAITADLTASLEPKRAQSSDGKHTVRNGETLWSIARRHNVSMNELASANSMSTKDTLVAGQVLKVPGTAAILATTDASSEVNLQKLTYVVRAGDTLSHIAAKFRVRVNSLLDWNHLSSPHEIRAGQHLVMFVDDSRRSGG